MFKEKKKNSVKLFDYNWLKLYKDTINIENTDKIFDRVVIRHIGAVCILPIINSTKIILIKQYRYPVADFLLEIPAGKVEKNENLTASAIRECAEETGYLPNKISKIMEFYSAPGFCDEKLTLFLANDLQKVNNFKPDVDEQLEQVIIEIKEVELLLKKGLIKDAKSIIGLQWLINNEKNI